MFLLYFDVDYETSNAIHRSLKVCNNALFAFNLPSDQFRSRLCR